MKLHALRCSLCSSMYFMLFYDFDLRPENFILFYILCGVVGLYLYVLVVENLFKTYINFIYFAKRPMSYLSVVCSLIFSLKTSSFCTCVPCVCDHFSSFSTPFWICGFKTLYAELTLHIKCTFYHLNSLRKSSSVQKPSANVPKTFHHNETTGKTK